MTDKTAATAKAIDEQLVPIRASLDQLCLQIEEEGVNPKRHTTEALMEQLTSLYILEEEAVKTKNTRIIGAVRKERDRTRSALGFAPRRRRR